MRNRRPGGGTGGGPGAGSGGGSGERSGGGPARGPSEGSGGGPARSSGEGSEARVPANVLVKVSPNCSSAPIRFRHLAARFLMSTFLMSTKQIIWKVELFLIFQMTNIKFIVGTLFDQHDWTQNKFNKCFAQQQQIFSQIIFFTSCQIHHFFTSFFHK